jgi:MoxR-like ATPase
MKNQLLHAALFTPMSDGRWGLPLLLWGAPGTAKSATVTELARLYGLPCEVLSPGERGEGAFGVTPVPEQIPGDGTVLRYPPPEWVAGLRDEDGEERGIVFVDEINTAPPAIQPALLGLIQERRIGGHQLGPRVRVLGAANPVSQSAGGWDLAAPVANRCGHVEWPAPTAEEWGAWLTGQQVDQEAQRDALVEEEMVVAAWPEAWALAAGTVAAFLRARPNLLHKMPPDGSPEQGRAWPSPRTWEYATRALASARIHGLDDETTDELLAAFVGAAAAGEFLTWMIEADLPDPAALLDGTATFKPDLKRLDRTEAVLSACATLVTPAKADKRQARAAALWALCAEVARDAKDAVIPAAIALCRAGLQGAREAKPVLAALHDVISASETGRR